MRRAKGPPATIGRCARGAWRKPAGRSRVLVIAVALLALALLLAGTVPHGGQATAAPGDAGGPGSHTITYDKYSATIDGRRTFIWSGEFEYWRLPSPSEWLDILEKMKAEGYNAGALARIRALPPTPAADPWSQRVIG